MTKPAGVRVTGPLATYAQGFCDQLEAMHYTPLSAANQVRVMAHLSRWLAAHRFEPEDLSSDRIDQFLRHRRREGYTCWRSARGLEPLLAYLRRSGVVHEPVVRPRSVMDRLVAEYVEYLRDERDLASATIRRRQDIARDFLGSIPLRSRRSLRRLNAATVTRYFLATIRGHSVGSAGSLATGLRSLLRFLFLSGHISAPLTPAVPKLAGWRQTSLPRAIKPEDVGRLLNACDRRTSVGRRDYAVLLLLTRLGLRAGEVAAMQLEDLDWRRGEILVHGKGNRDDRLPLPPDVGAALAAYLRRGRPKCDVRAVFVGHRAPHRELSPPAITACVRSSSARAGLMPSVSPHRLRHTAATQLLRQGNSLAEIAEVLRHRSLQTTAIYAKVDRESLRPLAQAWPRVEP